MIERHFTKLRLRDDISREEENALRAAIDGTISFPADRIVLHAGRKLTHSTLLLDGIACRYKDLRGGERQVTGLHLPGDFLDLHGFTLKRLDQHVATLTACTFATVPHAALTAITERLPHLTRAYWFETNLDAAIHREWEVSLGRRTARGRLAHLFCELQVRLKVVGLAEADGYALPLTQSDLAECMGLTTVHTNRTLRELRTAGLVEFRDGRVTILDPAGLRQAADFDPAYLYLDKRAR